MTTPEAKVKLAVTKMLDKNGVYYFYPATHGYGRSGIPDIICCLKGKFIAIECKAGKNRPTALQDRELSRIHKAGGKAFVANENNVDDLEHILSNMTVSEESSYVRWY